MKLLSRSRHDHRLALLGESETNVRLVAVVPPQVTAPGACFLVKDGNGEVHPTGASSRQAALRELGGFAIRGAAAPLLLLAPDGTPTGDRLA